MAGNTFSTITSNTLETVEMFAGSEKTLIYDLYSDEGVPIETDTLDEFIINIFSYGDPTNVLVSVSGCPVIESPYNRFNAVISASSTYGFSGGMYQQQILAIDNYGKTHIPAQGKVVIFPGVAY